MTHFRTGDLIQTKTIIATTFNDRLAGTGLSPGTVGVVTATTGSRMTVDFKDALWGHVTANGVPMHSCRLVRRDYGIETFHRNRTRTRPIRLGIALFSVGPFVWFAIQFFLTNGLSLDGFIPALVASCVDSVFQLVEWAVEAPLKTAVLLAFFAAIGWAAKRV